MSKSARHTAGAGDQFIASTGESPRSADDRKAYEPPRVLSRQNLEAIAAACPQASGGKSAGQPGCTLGSS
jgi:hypothetical protein